MAHVLSHLGSGREWHQIAATSATKRAPENQSVWDRWNAMSSQEQASSFVAADERLVSSYQELTAQQRSSISVDIGFLPAPVPLPPRSRCA